MHEFQGAELAVHFTQKENSQMKNQDCKKKILRKCHKLPSAIPKNPDPPSMLEVLFPKQFSLGEPTFTMPNLKNVLHFPFDHNQLPKLHAEGQQVEQLLMLF